MRSAGLRTATVVGHGGSGTADGMSVRQQKRVLEDIKQYMYQVVTRSNSKNDYFYYMFSVYAIHCILNLNVDLSSFPFTVSVLLEYFRNS